jgi:putative ABC transport system permease protein
VIGYYLRLALFSFRRNPGLTALMTAAIGLGIAVCVTTLTIYRAMAGNPIPQKSDRLYAVTMDSWAVERPANRDRPSLPPTRLTYRDAAEVFRSEVPERKVMMFQTVGVVRAGGNLPAPMRIRVRVTTGDFFPMFDVPFQFGSGWDANADNAPVIVLSREFNERMFGGANSVGRTLVWNNREFRVAGVLGEWHPRPLFYDLNEGSFNDPEDVYIPFGWSRAMELRESGNVACWKFEDINKYDALLNSECTWIQMWVELPDAAAVQRMQAVLDAHWAEQRKAGRFGRPRNNRLTNVGQWLIDQEVVQNDNRVLVQVAFAFLGVCLLNTVGLLLAKFLNESTWAGVRRALGASRGHIFLQHFTEVGLISCAGALLGLALSALGLWAVRTMYQLSAADAGGGYVALAQFDAGSLGWAALLAVVATVLAGVYPAWRVGRLAPATCLKSQ